MTDKVEEIQMDDLGNDQGSNASLNCRAQLKLEAHGTLYDLHMQHSKQFSSSFISFN